jgi:PAS domain S-box-containing protein
MRYRIGARTHAVHLGGLGVTMDITETNSSEEIRSRLAAIVDSSEDAIISKDLNGILTSWNAAAERLFGYSQEEIVGKSVLTIIPPELHHEEPGILAKIRRGEKIEHYETERVRKDGRRVFVSLTISPVKDSTGKVIGASKIARDITERRRLDDIRSRLAAIVDSSDDAIIAKDLNGIITHWNESAERLFGYQAEEIIGQSVLTIIPSELHDEEPLILASLRAGEKIDHYETERLRKDGRRVAVSITISPIKDEKGRIIGASKIARDISERKKVEEALIQSEKLAATGRMAAALAHEVNNPLAAVTNLAYLISTDDSLSEAARRYTQMLMAEVARASEMTKQGLAFYRDSGRQSTFDVRELIEDVVKVYRPTLEKRGIEVIADYRRFASLFGYASEIRQVFANLFLNAMDAVPDGGRIITRVDVKNSSVHITFADNGHGIRPEMRAHLFEPFITTKGAKGNGLGLWVSNGIVEKHGGRIAVRSSTRAGRSGTVFSVSLPVDGHATAQRRAS